MAQQTNLLSTPQWPIVPLVIAPANVTAHLTGPPTTRPLYAGEYVTWPNGGWSTEISSGTTDDQGITHVHPTLWLVHGVPYVLPPAIARQFAAASGLRFPQFTSIAAAEAYTRNREAAEQNMQPTQWRPMFSPIDQSIFAARQDQSKSLLSRLLGGG